MIKTETIYTDCLGNKYLITEGTEIKVEPKTESCKHTKIVAEFMGGGFLHSCANCGKTMYGL